MSHRTSPSPTTLRDRHSHSLGSAPLPRTHTRQSDPPVLRGGVIVDRYGWYKSPLGCGRGSKEFTVPWKHNLNTCQQHTLCRGMNTQGATSRPGTPGYGKTWPPSMKAGRRASRPRPGYKRPRAHLSCLLLVGTLEEVGSPLRAECCFCDKCVFHQPLSTAPREKEPMGEAGRNGIRWVSRLQVNPPHPAAAGEACALSLTHPRTGEQLGALSHEPSPRKRFSQYKSPVICCCSAKQ